jgi:hypothetical protein
MEDTRIEEDREMTIWIDYGWDPLTFPSGKAHAKDVVLKASRTNLKGVRRK